MKTTQNLLASGQALLLILAIAPIVFAQADVLYDGEPIATPSYNIDLTQTSVSGISSGGYMAQQFHVANSAWMVGAGIVAGGPYYCAENNVNEGAGKCVKGGISDNHIDQFVAEANQQAAAGRIDDTAHLSDDRIWLLHGKADDGVNEQVMDALESWYQKIGVAAEHIDYQRDHPFDHTWPQKYYQYPGDNHGNTGNCFGPDPDYPFIGDCDYDAAGALLNHIYDNLNSRNGGALSGHILSIRQDEHFNAGGYGSPQSMNPKAYIYVPESCATGDECRLHVSFHGCEMNYNDAPSAYSSDSGPVYGLKFVENSGLNEWADANSMIVLYPQAKKSSFFPTNPKGCWDFWNYEGGGVPHTQQGKQIDAIRDMMMTLAAGFTGNPHDPGDDDTSGYPAGAWQSERVIGGKLKVHVYVPNNPGASNNKRGLMVSLHGCTQSHDDFKAGANWAKAADAWGMVIALPMASKEGTYGSLLGCWNFHTGMESNRDSSDQKYILDMVSELLTDSNLNIDAQQIYLTGLSSGAAMANQLGCLAPDVFAGIGVNAGVAPGSTGDDLQNPSVSIQQGGGNCFTLSGVQNDHLESQVWNTVHGKNDNTVSIAHAHRNTDIALSVYSQTRSVSQCQNLELAGGGDLTLYCDGDGPRVSKLLVNGLAHAWPAGPESSGGGAYVDHSTVNYPNYITEFFYRNNRRVPEQSKGNPSPVNDQGTGEQPDSPWDFDVDLPIIVNPFENGFDIPLGGIFDIPSLSAWDGLDGDLSNQLMIWTNLNTQVSGQYLLTYNVNDSDFNSAQQVVIPLFVGEARPDITPPVLTLAGAENLEIHTGSFWQAYDWLSISDDYSVTVNEETDQTLSASDILVGSNVNVWSPGIYSETYNATDASGNVATELTRTVTVVNCLPMTLLPEANSLHILAGRAHHCGFLGSRACANGSNEDLGLVSLGASFLKEPEPNSGHWHSVSACL